MRYGNFKENYEIWKFPILTSPQAANYVTQPESSLFLKGQHGSDSFGSAEQIPIMLPSSLDESAAGKTSKIKGEYNNK